jgi:hypothetical protein
MRHPRVLAVVAVLVLSGAASAQAVYKNTKLGFSFKPPKDYKALPVDPTEHIMIVKYQSDQMDYGGAQGDAGYSSMMEVRFFPKSHTKLSGSDEGNAPGDAGAKGGGDSAGGGDGSEGDDDMGSMSGDSLESTVESIKSSFTKLKCTKDKGLKLGTAAASELAFESEDELSFYFLVVQQDDGMYVFEGSCISKRFSKQSAEFASCAKSFKRIDRVEDHAKTEKVAQMDDQERFLQEQIDKLPPGWSHMRTKRYMFLFDADKGFVQELADRIEMMRDQYERDYPPDHPITTVSIVRVCGSPEEYTGYGGPDGSGGYWYYVARELVVFDMRPREQTLATINHEAFHQYIYYFYGQLAPHPWYNEGTGDFYAGAKLSKSGRITAFGDPPGGIRRLEFIKEPARLLAEGKGKAEGAAAPLKQAMHFHHDEYYGSAGYYIGTCYAEGWSINHFLRQGKGLDPKWQKILPDYLKALLKARDDCAKEAMDKAIADAEKEEPGSSAKLPHDLKDWYDKTPEDKVQDRAFDTTFTDWTDADWTSFQTAWLKYVEKL